MVIEADLQTPLLCCGSATPLCSLQEKIAKNLWQNLCLPWCLDQLVQPWCCSHTCVPLETKRKIFLSCKLRIMLQNSEKAQGGEWWPIPIDDFLDQFWNDMWPHRWTPSLCQQQALCCSWEVRLLNFASKQKNIESRVFHDSLQTMKMAEFPMKLFVHCSI